MDTGRLIVLRHGEAENNREQRYNSDPSHAGYFVAHLTDLGKEQVHRAGEYLLAAGFSCDILQHVYVSPLPRALETAHILVDAGVIAPDFIVDDRLIEVQMGDREGKRYDEFPEDSWDHSRFAQYHGESDAHVGQRVQELMREVRERYPSDTVLFITHGTPALKIIELFTGSAIKLQHAEYMLLDEYL